MTPTKSCVSAGLPGSNVATELSNAHSVTHILETRVQHRIQTACMKEMIRPATTILVTKHSQITPANYKIQQMANPKHPSPFRRTHLSDATPVQKAGVIRADGSLQPQWHAGRKQSRKDQTALLGSPTHPSSSRFAAPAKSLSAADACLGMPSLIAAIPLVRNMHLLVGSISLASCRSAVARCIAYAATMELCDS